MPNWCSNEVDVIASPDNLKEFKAFLKKAQIATEKQREAIENSSEDREFFNLLVPMPKQLKDTNGRSASDTEMKDAFLGIKSRKYTDWYAWRLAHWGCKWDVHLRYVWGDDTKVTIDYDSPWAPAREFWGQVAAKFPSLTIKQRYFEEGVGFIGETHWVDGDMVKDISMDISTKVFLAAGCVLNDEGEIDWDADQEYNLFSVFEDGLENLEE